MKKFLMSFLALIVISLIFTVSAQVNVKAAEPTSCEGQKTLNFHYFRFDGDYSQVGLHVWNTGVYNDTYVTSTTDDFGALIKVCINVTPVEGTTTYTIGAIPLGKATDPAQKWNSKDTYNDSDLSVDITELVTTDATVQDVYFIQDGSDVLQIDETTGTAIVVYYDPTQDYDEWGIHTWNTGTGGTAPGWDTPLAFTAHAYYNNASTNQMQIAAISVGSDASDTIGFIVHKGNDKKYGSDINLDVTDIKGSGVKVFYYVAGDSNVILPENLDTFIENAFSFKFVPMNLTRKTGTYAPSPEVIRVEFNRDITIKSGDSVVFDPTFFTLKEGDNVIPIEVKYNSTSTSTRVFSISFNDDYTLDNTKNYTLYFNNQDVNEATRLAAELAIDMDRVAPVIALVEGNEFEITQGDEFIFPDYVATDDRDGIITKRVYVPTGKGFLDTGVVGEQEIALTVSDAWGNTTEIIFTVNVKALPVNPNPNPNPNDDDKDNNNLPLIIGLSVGGVALLGAAAFFVLRKSSK